MSADLLELLRVIMHRKGVEGSKEATLGVLLPGASQRQRPLEK